MRRIILWIGTTVSVLVLIFGYHTSTEGAPTTVSAVSGATAGAPAADVESGSSNDGSASDGSSGDSADGDSASSAAEQSGTGSSDTSSGDSAGGSEAGSLTTVTGDVVQTDRGAVQVQVTLDGDTITDVSVPQYPDDSAKHQQINSNALPILISETIDAQSADIDMVSGATATSEGYIQSLQSALDAAGI